MAWLAAHLARLLLFSSAMSHLGDGMSGLRLAERSARCVLLGALLLGCSGQAASTGESATVAGASNGVSGASNGVAGASNGVSGAGNGVSGAGGSAGTG